MAGNRSENTYQKINTIFKRDANNVIMPYDKFVSEDFEWLKDCKFDAEEKIDGTNIRIEVERVIEFTPEPRGYKLNWNVMYKGKSDKAQIPKNLLTYLQETFPEEKVLAALGLEQGMYVSVYNPERDRDVATDIAKEKKWCDLNGDGTPTDNFNIERVPYRYTLYGEGYGAGIQSGGYYRKDVAFIGFDVKVDDMYLLKPNRDEIFNKLGADIVPFIGQLTITEAIDFVKEGLTSRIAQEEHLAEGLVLRTPMGLKDRAGNRIIFKVKTCDWNKYHAKYGTYDKVDQPANKFY